MNRISLLEKLRILWKVSLSSYWFPIVLILLVTMGLFFLQTNPKNRKRNRIVYICFSLCIFLLVTIIYYPSLNHFFDYFMDNAFVAVLFPNPAIYFLMLIVMNAIVWISLFHYKTSDTIKKINVIVYIIMNYLLALILKAVKVSNLNIFKEASLFSNEKATALLELSSSIFVIWIIFLILYKIILIYVRKDYKPRIKKVVVARKKLPENFQPIVYPDRLKGNVGKRVTLIEAKNPNYDTKEFENMFTVEDYRLLRKILKEEKAKEKNEELEKKILVEEKKQMEREKEKLKEKERIAEMKLQEKIREEEKFTELEMLYRSIK